MAEKQIQPQQPAEKKELKKFENVTERVLDRIEKFQADGALVLPANYAVENHMKSAWLVLQATEDKDHRPVLDVCTKDSIANSLFDMVLQGLSVSKKQGYFVAYGNRLEFQRSYFGTVALAKRAGGIKTNPVANVIYEGDEFVYTIDPNTARIKIIKHEQKIDNIDNDKIKAAYALVTLNDGSVQVTIMSMQQIRAAWNQGSMKGNSPAHKNFTEEMAKKTVIGRACKMIINSSDDAWLYEGKSDEMDIDNATRQREASISSTKSVVETQDAEYEEVKEPTPAPAPTPTSDPTSEEEGPGY